MKKLLTCLTIIMVFTFMTGTGFACSKDCNCGCQQGKECTCNKKCDCDGDCKCNCDCGCHKGEKCDKENCSCKCHKKFLKIFKRKAKTKCNCEK